MVYQISLKDVRKAMTTMNNGVAVVVCSASPRMSFAVSFHVKDDGTAYVSPSYQVGNFNACLPDNYNLISAISQFNADMARYEEEH